MNSTYTKEQMSQISLGIAAEMSAADTAAEVSVYSLRLTTMLVRSVNAAADTLLVVVI